MMAGSLHFEILFRPFPGGSWELIETHGRRDDALESARRRIGAFPRGAARVTKEVLRPGSDIPDSILVATFGELGEPLLETARRRAKTAPEPAPLPCQTVADLWKAPARLAIAEHLQGFLKRFQALPLELLHRTDLIEYLEADDFAVDYAVQRAALGREHPEGIHKSIRQLKELINGAIARVLKDEVQGKFRDLPERGLAAFVRSLGAQADGQYLLGAAIARRIASSPSWSGKLGQLTGLHAQFEPLTEDGDTAWALEVLGDFLTEFCACPGAMDSSLGNPRNPARQLEMLTRLACGDDTDLPTPVAHLAVIFARGGTPAARSQIYRRGLALVRAPLRLFESDLRAEAMLTGRLYDYFVEAEGAHITSGEIAEAFSARARQILAEDRVETHLAPLAGPARIEHLLALGAGLRGDAPKRRLVAMIEQDMGRRQFWGSDADSPPLECLTMLARLQDRVEAAGLDQDNTNWLMRRLDDFGIDLMRRLGILARIAESGGRPLEKAAALLSIAARGQAPRGHCRLLIVAKAHSLIASAEGRTDLASRPEAGIEIEHLRRAALADYQIAAA